MPLPDKPTITVPEAARLLGISRGLAYEAVRTGTIPSIRVGRRILVPVKALGRLLEGDQPTEDATQGTGW